MNSMGYYHLYIFFYSHVKPGASGGGDDTARVMVGLLGPETELGNSVLASAATEEREDDSE